MPEAKGYGYGVLPADCVTIGESCIGVVLRTEVTEGFRETYQEFKLPGATVAAERLEYVVGPGERRGRVMNVDGLIFIDGQLWYNLNRPFGYRGIFPSWGWKTRRKLREEGLL